MVSLLVGDVPEDRAVELVPVDASFYATVFLDPSLSQKRATKEVLDRAQDAGAGDGSSESLEDAIGDLVTESTDVDYKSDIKPYAGSQMAIYVGADGESTLLMATDDPHASQRTMHDMLEREYPTDYYRLVQGSYRQQPYEHVLYREFGGAPSGSSAFAVVGGFVVIGSEADVKASIDAHSGTSLAATDRFSNARASLSDDVLAFAYFDDADSPTSETVTGNGPVAATLAARDSHVELDLAVDGAPGNVGGIQNPAALLKTLPADAIAAVSFGDLEGPLREVLDDSSSERGNEVREGVDDLAELDADGDLASWLGQLGIYLAGNDTDTVEGALVAETRSPQDSDRALDQIEGHYSSSYDFDNYVFESEDGLGFDVVDGSDVLQVRGDDDRVIAGMGAAGFSTDRALSAEGGFGESDLYRRAISLLGGYEPFLAIDAQAVRRLLEDATEAQYDEAYMSGAREWLSAVSTVAGGVSGSGDDMRIRLVAEVGE